MPAAALPLADGAAEEVDVWWGAYAGRTMVPSFLVCGLLTVGIVLLAWYLWRDHWLPAILARQVGYAFAGAVWLFQLVRWLYRVLFYNYRLTTRRLFHHLGSLYPSTQLDLTRVAKVLAEQNLAERLLGVGRVRVILEDAAAGPVVLEGVFDPRVVAEEIQACARQAREQNVLALRI